MGEAMTTATPKAPKRGILRLIAIGFTSFILCVAVLVLGASPNVPPTVPPSSAQVNAARALFSQLKAASREQTPVRVQVKWSELESAAILAGHAIDLRHVRISHQANEIKIDASKSLPLGFWINFGVRAIPAPNSFPAFTGYLGRIPLPQRLTRFAINFGRSLLKWRGISVPKPEILLSDLTLATDYFTAMVNIPKDSRIYAQLNSARGRVINTGSVANIYCALTTQQRANPSDTLAIQIRRAFSLAMTNSDHAATNRATLVALSMLVIAPEAGRVAGEMAPLIKDCRMDAPEIKLLGRADLAKHWTLSAAMAGTFGSALSQAMGTWKEISDSGPTGSGFSFVDLAADRSGIYFGQSATQADSAIATARKLSLATEDLLLPMQALSLIEGLDQGQFSQQFDDTDSASYARMVEKIDMVLAKSR